MRSRMLLAALVSIFSSLIALAQDSAASRTAEVRGYRATEKVNSIILGAEATPEQALTDLAKLPSSLRFDGSKPGDVVHVYAFYHRDISESDETKRARAEVRASEKVRQPLIVGQLAILRQIISALAANQGRLPAIAVERFQYVLKLKRADLKVTAEIKKQPNGLAPLTDGEAQDADWYVVFDFTNRNEAQTNAARTEANIQTGLREAWSISADVPLSTIGDVKVDDAGENIELAETPDAVYAGFNYSPIGDVLRTPENLWEAVNLKVLLKVSRRPSDSFGVGVGLRPGLFAERHPMLQILDTLSPYVAYTRTRVEEEQKNPDGTAAGTLRFKRNEFTIGLSLNLEKALEFVRGNGESDEEDQEPEEEQP